MSHNIFRADLPLLQDPIKPDFANVQICSHFQRQSNIRIAGVALSYHFNDLLTHRWPRIQFEWRDGSAPHLDSALALDR